MSQGNKGGKEMNETAPLQKQDLSHIDYKLDEIVKLLAAIEKLLSVLIREPK